MGLSVGIAGLPNVGKSTLLNALTQAHAEASNYPFCTIEPNTGVVEVPDERIAVLDKIVSAARTVPATVEFVDIAGIVKGASKGEGLGNKFLANIRETDAIVHVVRCFDDDNVIHVDGQPDPLRDVETIQIELGLADLETLEKRLDRAVRGAKSGDKTSIAEKEFFEKLIQHISDGNLARSFSVPDSMAVPVQECHLLTIKPVLYVANVDDASLGSGNAYSTRLESWAEESAAGCLRICGQVEAELSELEDEEKTAFLEDMGVAETGLYRLSHAAYQLLGLQTFFTAGDIEVKAWTIHKGDRAPTAAGEIHSDFESNFIRAEVIAYDQYVEVGGETGAKAKGVMRVEGKEYEMQDGDVVHFRVGV